MGQPEAEQAESDEEFLGPEPPPLGSAAYRRVILRICATHTQDEYDALMNPVWQWRGWRAGVEVMVELMGALAVNARPEWHDAFGKIRVDNYVVELDDEQILLHAHKTASSAYPDMLPHEAFARCIQDGEEMRDLCRSLIPYWNEAATMLRSAQGLADLEPARVVFTRWLNAHYRDRRVWAASLAAHTTHTHWRWRVMPPGDGWVDEVLSPSPDLRGSGMWSAGAPLADTPLPVPRPEGGPLAGPVKRVKGGKKAGAKCCPGCGRKRPKRKRPRG